MEDSLGLSSWALPSQNVLVLILVVMEDSLGPTSPMIIFDNGKVLILVVMEDSLGPPTQYANTCQSMS